MVSINAELDISKLKSKTIYIQTKPTTLIIGNFNCKDVKISCMCDISGILQSCISII